ncbi:hypothetical protein SK128_023292, partial [Halocaridina rubra]
MSLSYHADMTYLSSQNKDTQILEPRHAKANDEYRHQSNYYDSYLHDYYLNNDFNPRERDNEYSYLDGSNGYHAPDHDSNDMTTSFLSKEKDIPYHDPTCTINDCQRPSCLIPDYTEESSIPYHALTSYDQPDHETGKVPRSSRSRHHKRHRHRSKCDMGASLNASHPHSSGSYQDGQEVPATTEGISETLRREKRPL